MRYRCNGSGGTWALCASVVVHLAAMAAFCLVHMSAEQAGEADRETPKASVSQVRQATQSEQPRPKPRVTETKKQQQDSSERPDPEQVLVSGPGQAVLSRGDNSESRRTVNAGSSSAGRTTFFGSASGSRRISYVVDASGSLHGFFSRVRGELIDSISALEPDQYFAITFFGKGQLMEYSPGQMLRASPNTKAQAVEFINSIGPEGKTDALRALRRGGDVKDAGGHGPEVIYFLTDGFELAEDEGEQFVGQLTQMLNRQAPGARVNVIAVWPDEGETELLRDLAGWTNGDFRLVDNR